jgi:hypothetical protein
MGYFIYCVVFLFLLYCFLMMTDSYNHVIILRLTMFRIRMPPVEAVMDQ